MMGPNIHYKGVIWKIISKLSLNPFLSGPLTYLWPWDREPLDLHLHNRSHCHCAGLIPHWPALWPQIPQSVLLSPLSLVCLSVHQSQQEKAFCQWKLSMVSWRLWFCSPFSCLGFVYAEMDKILQEFMSMVGLTIRLNFTDNISETTIMVLIRVYITMHQDVTCRWINMISKSCRF